MREEAAMELLDLLNAPPREFTPVPFWFLNGDLIHEEIRRQMKDFCDHGVFGAVLHPRMGLSDTIGYLSPAYFSYIRTALETAAELDMRIVLYDEGMYPSGSAGGFIVKENSDWASRGLGLVSAPEAGDQVLCETEKGFLVERFSGGTIRGVHFGEDDGEENAPKSADILNPQAVKRFIELTHEAYYREFSEYFGNTVIGFFTDEPSILGRNVKDLMPWTKDFDQAFIAAGGNLAGLTGLFTGQENADTRLYHSLILEREGRVYYASLSRWCEEHGIALMGHPHQSDDIEVQRYFHTPGQDLVFRWVSPEKGGTEGMDSVMGKCSADAARLMRRRRNSNECFGACNRNGNPWHFTGEDMKWYIDWLAVRGVNLFIPHAFYYSLEGQRSQERPPDVGPGSIWWPHYKRWADYMARMSCLMTDTDLHADIAVLCRNRDMKPEAVKPLFEAQRGFQYLPESVWPECEEKNGQLVYRGKAYRVVIGPDDQFSSVSHKMEMVEPDIACNPPQPALRCARFIRAGRVCWLLVNEGNGDIVTEAVLPMDAFIAQYDLWNAQAYRLNAKRENGKASFRLRLRRRESLLLYACDSAEEWEALPEKKEPQALCADFLLAETDEENHRKAYTASLPRQSGDCELTVNAEEMAELYVNGAFCCVSFWGPHRLLIPDGLLSRDENELRLIVTGSLANKYGKPVLYGMS